MQIKEQQSVGAVKTGQGRAIGFARRNRDVLGGVEGIELNNLIVRHYW